MKVGTGNLTLTLTASQVMEALTEYFIAHFGELMEGRKIESVKQETGSVSTGLFVAVLSDETPRPLQNVRAA